MQTFKSVFFKPDPQEQKRKCDSIIRQNVRAIDRDIMRNKANESKTANLIRNEAKMAQRRPAMANDAKAAMRRYAKEIANMRKQTQRLSTSKAQLQSVQMQVNEAFSIRKIEGSLKVSTGIMKDVNTLIRLPELTGSMQVLSQELMKAGIIEEMVGDMLPDDQLLEADEEEAEGEVDKVLANILGERLPAAGEQLPEVPAEMEEEEAEDREAELAQMRNRLEALKS